MKLLSRLLRFVLNESQSRQNVPSAQGSSSSSAGGPGIPQPPPGMSFYAAKRVIGDSPWTPEQLEQVLATAGLVLNELGMVTGMAAGRGTEGQKGYMNLTLARSSVALREFIEGLYMMEVCHGEMGWEAPALVMIP